LSLVTRIFVLIGLMLSFDAGHEIYDGVERRAAAEEELRSRATSLAQIAALDIERTFEAARQVMTVLSTTPAIRDRAPEACSAQVKSVKHSLPMYDFISVAELDGRIPCTSSSPKDSDLRGRSLANREGGCYPRLRGRHLWSWQANRKRGDPAYLSDLG
jgi:hypothetical protein